MNTDWTYLKNNHDLSLSEWGPYTKKYMGISHVADDTKGMRFDLSVYAALYRRKTEIPNVMWENNFHPWNAAPDLSHYTYRQELEWKDRLTCDISFTGTDGKGSLVTCRFKNNTNQSQNAVLNYMAYMTSPTRSWGSLDALGNNPPSTRVKKPHAALWLDALNYDSLDYAVPRPTDGLVADGLKRGEQSGGEFVGGSGIGCGFGRDRGDWVSYSFSLSDSLVEGCLVVRYRVPGEKPARFSLSGFKEDKLIFKPSENFDMLTVPLEKLEEGHHEFVLTSEGDSSLELDGFLILPLAQADQIDFYEHRMNPVPRVIPGPVDSSVILKYDECGQYYGIYWDFPEYRIREILNSDLDSFMKYFAHDHVNSILRGDGEGHYLNAFIRPIFLEAGGEKTIYGYVTNGSRNDVFKKLEEYARRSDYSALCKKGEEKVYLFRTAGEGEKYLFGQERMAATTLSNVVYPIYAKGQYIRHNTPGRWWNSLYTWDSGFCGLGLLEIDVNRAVECLNAYVTEPGDDQTAFIHHGSMVPVQFYLFHEIMNRTGDGALAEFFYPRLKAYYDFYCGKTGGSTTAVLKSDLLKTWDYFYNSGGWDDYPPQVYVHEKKWEAKAAPVVNTAHAIRIAKIMAIYAGELGFEDDVLEYGRDLDRFSQALMTHALDRESGFFGYVLHDGEGKPADIMRTPKGENFNKGLGGLSPLIAGICPGELADSMVEKLFDEDRFFTKAGLSTVDKSASYYREDGYWNGAVWMPHQWFYWKTMLDLGRHDLAWRIARTALDLWENEVRESYNCYEHFIVESGRGAGWHHFGGLSTPVLSWFQSYHGLGRLTGGFNTAIRSLDVNGDQTSLQADLTIHDDSLSPAFIVCMNPEKEYSIRFNGKDVPAGEHSRGTYYFTLTKGTAKGKLTVNRQQ